MQSIKLSELNYWDAGTGISVLFAIFMGKKGRLEVGSTKMLYHYLVFYCTKARGTGIYSKPVRNTYLCILQPGFVLGYSVPSQFSI